MAYGTIKPGCSAEYSTFTAHPWILREMHSRRRMNINGSHQARVGSMLGALVHNVGSYAVCMSACRKRVALWLRTALMVSR